MGDGFEASSNLGGIITLVKKHYVVIVLGLGEVAPIYKFLTRNWVKRYSLIPVVYVVGWRDKHEQFEKKLARLVDEIKAIGRRGDMVSLIGVSAGASATLNAYIILKKEGYTFIRTYVSVCGRFNLDAHWWYPLSYGVKSVPLFEKSVFMVMNNMRILRDEDYYKMTAFYSLFDEVVPNSASTLKYVSHRMIPFPFHLAIYYLFLFPLPLITLLQ